MAACTGDEEPPAVPDLHLRFTMRAQARPTTSWPAVPRSDPRTVDVERTEMWGGARDDRHDPMQPLSPR
jgi:hypothetical protein